jgi:hypothetical protein
MDDLFGTLAKATKPMAYDTLLCAVCGSNKKVEFVKITDCNLCEKCNKELADSFECSMRMDRSNDPEL